MTSNYVDSTDDIFSAFKTLWDAEAALVVGYVPEVRWQGVELPEKPDASKYWARASRLSVTEEQANLSGNDLKRRYTASGIAIVDIFCPKSDVEAMYNGRQLSAIARDSFRVSNATRVVWFRNARINEVAPDNDFLVFRVIAEFEYDEIG